jgi:lysophospholipase L1-like esterase
VKNKITIIFISVVVVSIAIYFILRKEPITNYPSQGTDIIAFGDSLVEGMGADKDHNFVAVLSDKIGEPIVNLGHSGDTTRDGLARIDELDNYKPKAVLLLLGGNDYLKNIPVEETRANLSLLIENIQSRGAVVLLLGVRGGVLGDPFKKEFKDLRDKYQTAFVSDVLSGLIGDMRYMSDAIHPNAIGYGMIADRVYPVLVKLLK